MLRARLLPAPSLNLLRFILRGWLWPMHVLPYHAVSLTLLWLGLCMLTPGAAFAEGPLASVQLEELTWTEVRDAVNSGTTTVIIPVGGTEQSGPHLALGKHNVRVKILAERIARTLGHTVVAPVVAYVPEGRISPPTQHMRYSGTVSISDDAFKALIEGAARSFKQHGFTDVMLIGDHGGYQSLLQTVATRLNREWAASPARVHFIGAYYEAAQTPYNQALREHGLTDAQIGLHAGAADTSLMLATEAGLVRRDQMKIDRSTDVEKSLGVNGDPRLASAALGQIGVDLIVTRTVAAMRQATTRPR